ncbi:MAG: nicotianamine synthase family protein [Alphaproteobacteria bacterium]|nr:nicotianamine synthase family protein [Alphaproteobacteria bacterium]
MNTAALQDAVSIIRQSHRFLAQAQDLSPHNAGVTSSLTRLVRSLMDCYASDISASLVGAPDLQKARQELPVLCGKAECEMEKFWAQRLADTPTAQLADFWYYSEYCALTQAEIGLLGTKTYSRISFLGAGALPLTGFLMADHFADAQVVCVDYDEDACSLAARLARKFGYADRVDVRCMAATDYRPEAGELVICASLLTHRADVYARLGDCDCALIVRDAEGAYQFLYRPAVLPGAGFARVSKTEPDPKRINTSHFYIRDNGHG